MATNDEIRAKDIVPELTDFRDDTDGLYGDGSQSSFFMKALSLAKSILGQIHLLPTSITAFRTGDMIPVDGPDGTAKMYKDDLLRVTAENALANKVAPVFDASSTYNVGDRVIYNGVQYRCTTPHTGAFDVSHFAFTTSSYEDYVLGINFAPKFSTSANYRKGELCTLGGSLWRFKVEHSAGAWDVSEMELVNVADLYALQVNRRFTKMLTNSGFEQGRFDINGSYGGFSSTSPDHIKWCSHRNLLNLTSAKILKITQSSGYNADVFLQTYTVTTDSDYNDTFTKSTRYQYSVKSGVDFYIDVSAIEYGRISFNVNNGIPCITTDIEISLEFTPYTSLPADEKNYYEDLPNSDNLSGRCVVNQQGDGDYTDIGTAYNANRTGTNPALIDIIVQNGAYDWVNVAKLWAKGETRDYTIIRNTSASYPYAASMIGIGIIDTFTFYAHNLSPDNPAYALHIDLERNKNERCIYRNCRFISTRNCAIGVGMTKGYALWFEDCEFLSHSTTDAGAFFHDARASLGEGNYGGLQWLTFVRCKFKSKSEFALRILSVESSNKLIVTFIDCTFESDITANQNCVRICGTTTEGYLCGDSILLGSKSHGNDVDLLNAW